MNKNTVFDNDTRHKILTNVENVTSLSEMEQTRRQFLMLVSDGWTTALKRLYSTAT